MNIKVKLALPIISGFILIVFLKNYLWLPLQLEQAKIKFEDHTHELLVLGTAGIISHLLENDIGSLYSNVEQLEKAFKDRWFNIVIYNENNKRIYPVFLNNSGVTAQADNLIHISYPLAIENTKLGYLELDVDWKKERQEIIDGLNSISNTVLSIIFLILLVSTLSQYGFIYRPLKKLTGAANNIKKGDFNVDLTDFENDEIGELAKSFSAMQLELSFQKHVIDEHAIVSVADKNGLITQVNNRFVAISGYDRSELIGKSHRVIKSNTHPKEFYKDIWRTITSGNVWHGEICNIKKSGEKYWVSSTIVPWLNENGVPERYMSIRTDITKQKNSQEQLMHMANHDILTGLPTRRLGKENLSMAISLARREKKMVAAMFIDLDGFKDVNDELGHDAGDLLLKGVSERLVKCVREMDAVVRVGGDEFIVILTSIYSRNDASMVAQKIIERLSKPFTLDGNGVTIGASIGIALYPEHEEDPEKLIKCADQMMYVAKRKGKNNFTFYSDEELLD